MPAGCTWQRENPSLLCVSVDAGVERSPPNFTSMLPQFCCGEAIFQVEAHSNPVQPAVCRDGGPWSVIVRFWLFWMRFRKNQKTPLVAVLEHQHQVRQLPSRASLTDLCPAVRASDWLQATVLTKSALNPDLVALLPDDLQHPCARPTNILSSSFYE